MKIKNIIVLVVISILFTACANTSQNNSAQANTSEKKQIKKKLSPAKKLSYIKCSNIADRFDTGYSSKVKAMCLGKLSFIDVKSRVKSQKLSMLNAISIQTFYKLENSSCPDIVISKASGSKLDDKVSFKSTYKNQLLKHFDHNCLVDTIDGINFLTCGKNEKSYFMELSFSNNQKIYKKYMVQTGQKCFNKFKKYFNKDNLDDAWRSKQGYNTDGFNDLGHNILTDSIYDLKGYDYKGWNKDGINKITKTKYDVDGLDIHKLHKDGVDKDGWSPKLKKFVKKGKESRPYSFDVIKLSSQMKDELYNRSFYDDVRYIKTQTGFDLVGKKIYGKKSKPTKIVQYYFKSARKKLLDFDKPKQSIMKQRLILDKKVTRSFDKDGYDKDGFDKDGWNKKLKKFRNQIKSN
ncbi:hypothetical protein [Sulfurospirillum arcachonense]|uniref:hypothetical protein n=1 Tax=Sulfurospirillum arcachonense TaxID=57666 RepID=UPI00046AFD05|nr:hypothetical protein [Sulfurospirillum arcachonense]